MSEYIKREDVLQAIAGLLNVTEQIDGADVVEVVRCKDCQWWNECRMLDYDNGYCSEGERKDDEQVDTFDTSDGNNGDV